MASSTGGVVAICTWYIFVSAVLINFNKFMMKPSMFPYAVPLTTCHATATYTACRLFYIVAPSYFPSAGNPAVKEMSSYFWPVAVLFTVGVACSNQAYLYCSVSFLQFMKEWNVALVFMFSCVAGFQVCDRMKFFILMWIVVAGCLAVTGKMHFSHFGFFIQITSQLGETTRIVVQEWLLSQGGCRLDPLTFQLYLGRPTIFVLIILNYFYWDPACIAAFKASWQYLALSASVAVILNITISVLIKNAGGLAFVLSGIVKDVMIVTTSTYIAGEFLNGQQIVGFVFALLGICGWGLLKTDPSHILVRGLRSVLYWGNGSALRDLQIDVDPSETMSAQEEALTRAKYSEKKGGNKV